MGRKKNQKDKKSSNPSGARTVGQTTDSPSTVSQHQQGQSQISRQSQRQTVGPLQHQGEASTSARRPEQQPKKEDEWKSSQRSHQWSQSDRPQLSHSEQGPSNRGPQPTTHQDRKPQQWRSQPDKGQGLQKTPCQQEEGAWSMEPRNQRSHGGFSRAESTQSHQPKKPHATSKGSAMTQQKRYEPLTMEDVKKQGIEELQIKYKGPGKCGQPLGNIETNYVRLSIKDILDNIYHYDVSIEPNRPKKFLRKVFSKFIENNYPQNNVFVAFDGTNNAYASQRLQISDLQQNVRIIHPETGKELNFSVNIQEPRNSQIPFRHPLTNYNNPEVNSKRALQGLEVILKAVFQDEHMKRGLVAGRSFYTPPDMLSSLRGKDLYLGDGCELWLGLFQAVVLGDELFLNVDVSHKAFPKRYDSLFDMLKDIKTDLRLRDAIDPRKPLDPKVTGALQKQLSGLDVCYTQPGTGSKTVRKFVGIGERPGNCRFILNGSETTVLKYFTERRMTIKFPEMQCLKIGSRDDPITVPMEFCSISNAQVINKKCTENQKRNIIRHAETSTDERKMRIMNVLNVMNHNSSPEIQGFGVNIGEDFIEVPARKLIAPKIQYKNTTITPNEGVWNPVKMEFLITEPVPENQETTKPSFIVQWGILNADVQTDINGGAISQFCNKLHQVSKTTGVHLAPQPSYIKSVINRGERYVPDRELEQRIRKEFDLNEVKNKIKILICVIPDRGQMYGKIKKMAEIDVGVLTQCIKSKTVMSRGNDPSTISNIMLKINAKLNGTNHKLETSPIFTGEKCMFIGADVTHPSPDQRMIPSVVGVSASYDMNAFRYAFYWRLQGPRIEIIEDFKGVIFNHLKMYKRCNGVLPNKIFYYRDGVSEGQFDQVMAIERNAMVQACREIQPGYEKEVKMTVVIVQKRHHTRFFPGQIGVGKNKNVPAGTIVDTVITRPNENHFFLASHQAIQGVTKPTKYCILQDEGEHSIDDLQCLTYNLCHLFTRCNRAVSYPAPTYYAHLIAARARKYIENDRLNFHNLGREWSMRAIKDKIINEHPMFFV